MRTSGVERFWQSLPLLTVLKPLQSPMDIPRLPVFDSEQTELHGSKLRTPIPNKKLMKHK
jgi:hypothetical protein